MFLRVAYRTKFNFWRHLSCIYRSSSTRNMYFINKPIRYFTASKLEDYYSNIYVKSIRYTGSIEKCWPR